MKREPDSAGMQVQRLRLAGPVCLLRAGSGEGGLYMLLEGSGILHWGQGTDSGLGAGPGAVMVLGRTDCVFEPAGGRPCCWAAGSLWRCSARPRKGGCSAPASPRWC